MPVKCWTLVMSHKQRNMHGVKADMKGDSPPDSVITFKISHDVIKSNTVINK